MQPPFSNQDNQDLNDRMAMTAPQRGPGSTSREFSARASFRPMGATMPVGYAGDPGLAPNGLEWQQPALAGQIQLPPQYMQYEQQIVPSDNGQQPEDFVLIDVVGGGCASQMDSTGQLSIASRSVSVMHPSKPVVAYTAGCMIIVYDLLSDSKVNLMGHKHNVYALAFTPNGQSLLSVDFNRDIEIHNAQMAEGEVPQSSSTITLWDWQRGAKIQSANIPRTSSLSEALIQNQSASLMYGNHQDGQSGRMFDFTMASAKSTQSCYIQISFEKTGQLFMILESSPLDIGGGYRVTLWSFNKSQIMEVISSMDLELQSPCVEIGILPRNQSDVVTSQRTSGTVGHSTQVFLHSKISFFTAEKQCIKLWEYSQGNAQLKKRIHIKQSICSVVLAELTNFLLILGESGKLLILDSQGEFVSTLHKDGVVFTRIGTAHDKLLLGTNRGTVHVYHMASLQFISEIPYQLSFIEKFSLNSFNKSKSEIEQLSLSKVGPPVTEIGTTLNLRYLWIRYSDGSFAMIDRTIMNPKQAILGYSCGHFEYISDLQWIAPKSSFDLISRAGGYLNHQNQISPFSQDFQMDGLMKQGVSPQANHDLQFVTSSHDLSVHLWRHYGDRWAFSYIDIAKSFDQSLQFQRKQCDRSTREMKLTAICVYPRSNNIIVGDNKGYIRVFQMVNENAHLISTHKLQRTAENKVYNGLGISPPQGQALTGAPSLSVQADVIKQIYITNNEQIAVVTYQSGTVSLYDTKNGFSLIGDAVESDIQKFNTQQSSQDSLAIQTRVIENNLQSSSGNSIRDRINLYKKYRPTVPQQDEQPFVGSAQSQNGDIDSARVSNNYTSNTQQVSGILGAHGTSLKVLSLASPNQVSLQLVDVKGSRLASSKLNQFVISEGKVTGFDIHPSNDYLLVTSSKGRVYVFRIDTGELRGTIKIPLNSSDCHIDPSGLYVLIKVPAFAQQNTYNLMQDGGASEQERVGHFALNQKEFERNTLLMYEIGTGQPAAEIASIFEITSLQFSPDGQYLALGSTNGGVCVWSMGHHLHQNVKQVIDAMRMQSDFWFNYPIFLPDYEQFNNNLGQAPQDDANLFAIPPQDIAQAIIPPQARTFSEQMNRSMDQQQQQLSEAAMSMRQQQYAQGAPVQLEGNYQPQKPQTPPGNEDQFTAQQYHTQPVDPSFQQQPFQLPPPYLAVQQPGPVEPQGNLAKPKQMQVPPNQMQPSPMSNEQRFLRRAVGGHNQASNPHWRQAQLPSATQRNFTPTGNPNAIRASGQFQMPPSYRPMNQAQVQQPHHQQQPSAPPPQAMQNLGQQPFQNQPQYPNPNFYGYLDQPNAQNFTQPTVSPGQQFQFAGNQVPRPLTQQSASEILLGKAGNMPQSLEPNVQQMAPGAANYINRAANNIEDPNPEPVPENMSQQLYRQQPLAANVNGQETLDKRRGFEQFADMATSTVGTQQQPLQGPSGEKVYVLRPPNMDKVDKANFDKSLNDRDAVLTGSFNHDQLNQNFGGSRNMKQQSLMQNPHQMMPSLANQINDASAVNSMRPQTDQPLIQATRTTDPGQFKVMAFNNTQTQKDILQQNSSLAIKGSVQPDPANIDEVGDIGTGLATTTQAHKPTAPQNNSIELKQEDELDALNKYLGGVRVPQVIQGQLPNKSQTVRHPNEPTSKIYQLYKHSIPVPKPAANTNPLNSLAANTNSQTRGGNLLVGGQFPQGTYSNSEAERDTQGVKPPSSNYDLIDEVYQNIDDFEAKLGKIKARGI